MERAEVPRWIRNVLLGAIAAAAFLLLTNAMELRLYLLVNNARVKIDGREENRARLYYCANSLYFLINLPQEEFVRYQRGRGRNQVPHFITVKEAVYSCPTGRTPEITLPPQFLFIHIPHALIMLDPGALEGDPISEGSWSTIDDPPTEQRVQFKDAAGRSVSMYYSLPENPEESILYNIWRWGIGITGVVSMGLLPPFCLVKCWLALRASIRNLEVPAQGWRRWAFLPLVAALSVMWLLLIPVSLTADVLLNPQMLRDITGIVESCVAIPLCAAFAVMAYRSGWRRRHYLGAAAILLALLLSAS